MKINTLCIFGTCPEAIRMAPVIKRLAHDPRFNNQVCVISHHLDRMQSIFDLFQITPDYTWDVLVTHQDVARLTAKILLKLTEFFEQYRPDYVLVHGDTATTVTAAISAHYFHIPIVHIEAGFRTKDHDWSWPEETNRKLLGDVANVHFAPTFLARQNLLREGIASDAIYVSGSTAIDSLFDTLSYIRQHSSVHVQLRQRFSYLNPMHKIILVTAQRRENLGQGLQNICQALREIAQRFPEIDIVYPVALDPNVHQPVHAHLGDVKNIFLIEPTDYLSFIYLMQTSYLVITDSGGIQEEAPSLDKPVLLMREKTDRPEALEAGTVKLVGTDVEKIVYETTRLLKNQGYYQQMSQAVSPYGDGKAASRIVEILVKHFTKNTMRNEVEAYRATSLISEV